MTTKHRPTAAEDARSLAIIATAGVIAVVVTASLSAPAAPPATPPPVARVAASPIPSDAVHESDRIYGHVHTRGGSVLSGYLTWNGREASWTDRLAATRGEAAVLGGMRFGHLERLAREPSGEVRAELKSGRAVRLRADGVDATGALAPLEIEPGGARLAIRWEDVVTVDFADGPRAPLAARERLHGTVVTRAGTRLTGTLIWERGEAFVDDLLARPGGTRRLSDVDQVVLRPDGALAFLDGGRALGSLPRSALVGAGGGEIVVADPALGSVVVPLARLREVRFHPAVAGARYADFDGGRPLTGTVTTESGLEVAGRVRWDLDEAETWQLLDGQSGGAHFHIELGLVATVEKARWGADVTLRDGRTFHLIGTNDVNWNNRGVEIVDAGGKTWLVAWSDFRRIELDG